MNKGVGGHQMVIGNCSQWKYTDRLSAVIYRLLEGRPSAGGLTFKLKVDG
jgi:hypothetical protein